MEKLVVEEDYEARTYGPIRLQDSRASAITELHGKKQPLACGVGARQLRYVCYRLSRDLGIQLRFGSFIFCDSHDFLMIG